MDYPSAQIGRWFDGRDASMCSPAIQRLWVVEEGGVLGFVETAGAEITKLFVMANAAGRGNGRQLPRTALKHLAATGAMRAHLESTATAVGFYRREGFRVVGEDVFSHGAAKLKFVGMERALP